MQTDRAGSIRVCAALRGLAARRGGVAGCCAPGTSRHEETRRKILRGGSDANIGFDDLRGLLLHLGFEERTRGSHHIFHRPGVEELLNLQRAGANAKPCPVKQVRAVLVRYDLGGED